MKNIKIIIAIVSFSLIFTNCKQDDVLEYNQSEAPVALSFSKESDNIDVDPDAPVYYIEVQSTATTNQDRTITLSINEEESSYDAADFSFNNTVVIPAGSHVGQGEITFDFDNLTIGAVNNVVFDLNLPDDGSVYNITRPAINIEYTPLCPFSSVVLSITTDDWPDETTWELYDLSNGAVIIASGGPFVNPDDDFTTIDIGFCLEPGDYGVIVRDSYGDGISGGGYTVTANGVVVASGIVPASANPGSTPSFGSSAFTVD